MQLLLTNDPRHTHSLFLIGELVAALRANDSDLFRQWLAGGIQDLGVEVVEELLLETIFGRVHALKIGHQLSSIASVPRAS